VGVSRANATFANSANKNGIDRWKIIAVLLVLLVLPLLWRWTPLYEWVNLGSILEWQTSVRNDPAAPLYVIGAYLLGSLVLFPITILTLATVFAFGTVWGNIYALLGWLFSATEGYLLGRLIGQDRLHKLAGSRVNRLIDRVKQHGFVAVLALRLLPVAPFTVVNMFIGASGIRFRDFFLASLLARIPGIFTLALFGLQLENALRNPGIISFALLGVILVVLPLTLSRLMSKFYGRKGD
jgi:phospholipase D1/2